MVNGVEIHLHDIFPFFPVRLLNRAFDRCDCFILRQNARNREEACLHNRVHSTPHSRLLSNGITVNDVEVQFFSNNLFLCDPRQFTPHFVSGVLTVQKEGSAFDQLVHDIVLLQEQPLMTPDKVRFVDQVG